MDNLVLFVDLDGSLKSEHGEDGPYEVPSITVQSGPIKYVFAARPHLHEFLDMASKKAIRMILCTAAGGGYARKVLKAMNIDGYFTDIIAAEDYVKGFPIRPNWNCIFIDNDQEMVNLKVERLSEKSLISSYKRATMSTWVIDTYHGEKDDKVLLELMEEIENL